MTFCSTCNEKYLGDYCDCDEHFEEIQSKAILKILNGYSISAFTSENHYIDLGKNIDEIINEYLDFKNTYQYKNHIKNNKKLLKQIKKGIDAGSFVDDHSYGCSEIHHIVIDSNFLNSNIRTKFNNRILAKRWGFSCQICRGVDYKSKSEIQRHLINNHGGKWIIETKKFLYSHGDF